MEASYKADKKNTSLLKTIKKYFPDLVYRFVRFGTQKWSKSGPKVVQKWSKSVHSLNINKIQT